MLLLFFVLLLAPLIPWLVPRRWISFAAASLVLLTGILLLDEHTVSFMDKGMFGDALNTPLVIWTVVAVASAWARSRIQPRPRSYGYASISSPALPLLLLASILFMHWLRNRLAGFEPAWLPHLIFALLLLAGVGVLVVSSVLAGWKRSAAFTLGAGLFFPGALAGADALTANRILERAQAEARGRPFCLLTFAGTDYARPARHVFELSPLVSRFRGRTYTYGADFLIIQTDELPAAPMHLHDRFGREHFQNAFSYPLTVVERRRAAQLARCNPVPGGGVSEL